MGTFAWLIKKRRLIVDYEKLPERARIADLSCYGSSNAEKANSSSKLRSLIFYLQTVS